MRRCWLGLYGLRFQSCGCFSLVYLFVCVGVGVAGCVGVVVNSVVTTCDTFYFEFLFCF